MRNRRSAAGFTVIEVVVALFVLSIVLIGMLALFDASNKIARTQVNIADMQQSLRIGHDEMVRMARIAARGWVINSTSWKPEDQIKLAVDNAGPAVYIGTTTDPEFKVLPGTDVLRIRGVIVGSLFENEIGQEASCSQSANPDPLKKGGCSIEPTDLKINEISRSGLKQDLDQLQRAQDAGNDFTVLLVSKQGEVAHASAKVSDLEKTGNTINTGFIRADSSTSTESWVATLEEHPVALTGIIEEYAFYIRENDGQPRLAMARFKPGTNQPYGGVAENLRQDIADDIIDLQVALGIDTYTDTNAD
ncbi:MAG TPA: prepilin-type N-terminal cleavage/methylation domain-containing protein, partial [Thermoanaerobaculia bacterium]|nr:prepilin-type N-terminal cleavage/methylation domain-containing protein [Thermoanaerobaculia bacterium]